MQYRSKTPWRQDVTIVYIVTHCYHYSNGLTQWLAVINSKRCLEQHCCSYTLQCMIRALVPLWSFDSILSWSHSAKSKLHCVCMCTNTVDSSVDCRYIVLCVIIATTVKSCVINDSSIYTWYTVYTHYTNCDCITPHANNNTLAITLIQWRLLTLTTLFTPYHYIQ